MRKIDKNRRLQESVTERNRSSTVDLAGFELFQGMAGNLEVMIDSVISSDSLQNLLDPYTVIHFAMIPLQIDVEKILGLDYLKKDADGNNPIYESSQVQLVVDEACETMGLTEDGF